MNLPIQYDKSRSGWLNDYCRRAPNDLQPSLKVVLLRRQTQKTMKFLTYEARLRNDRKTRWGIERKKTPSKKRIRHAHGAESSTHRKRETILAPKRFSVVFRDDRSDLMRFLKDVSTTLECDGTARIDFSKVEELRPCGTLVFCANLDIWLHRHPGRVTCSYPKNAVVEQLFQHIGVLERLGLPGKANIDHEQVKHWYYHWGFAMDAQIYRDLTRSILDRIDHPERTLFADCLNEAVYNSVNHAYDFEAPGIPPLEQRKWWMFSQVKNGKIFAVIYDHGVSIPAHLLRRPEWRDYARLRKRDAQLIEAAVASPRTSTRAPHRGKGLPEMLEFSQKLGCGSLSILSRRGGFGYDARAQRHHRKKYSEPLPGTLVLWELPFQEDEPHE